nr:MAG TPA: hypothetical protein [Caudoviricetes sp.]
MVFLRFSTVQVLPMILDSVPYVYLPIHQQ